VLKVVKLVGNFAKEVIVVFRSEYYEGASHIEI
jgi:hypothetical protein